MVGLSKGYGRMAVKLCGVRWIRREAIDHKRSVQGCLIPVFFQAVFWVCFLGLVMVWQGGLLARNRPTLVC